MFKYNRDFVHLYFEKRIRKASRILGDLNLEEKIIKIGTGDGPKISASVQRGG